ncbi:MAG: molybdate ABC transporter substrate-binding protein [Inquilinaceae bacterium]
MTGIVPTLLGLVAALMLGVAPGHSFARERVVVFAAASLKTALDDAVRAWQAETGEVAVVSYAGSGALARQIDQGAPADLFLSANPDWMDYVQDRGLIDPETRVDLLGNRLVLIAPADGGLDLELAPGVDLAGALGPDGRLAVANVDAVPAGQYAREALVALGVWDSVADRLAQALDVRAALVLVSRGEAPAGIVYRTDAAVDPGVRTVATFPEDSHRPIVYPAAATADAGPEARALLAYLTSAAARPWFEGQGFAVID